MFVFQEGDVVSIVEDIPELDLVAGDRGVIWALYDTDPPAYEATFWPRTGDGFDMTVCEHEVTRTGLVRPVFERPVFEPEHAGASA